MATRRDAAMPKGTTNTKSVIDRLAIAGAQASTRFGANGFVVRGTTSDGGTVKRVSVNGQDARPVRPNFAEWEVLLPVHNGVVEPIAFAEDTSGNIEMQPHHATNGR
jgi:hypothetical protein